MAILSNDELADLLTWAADRVRAGDSFEGRIQYTFADSGDGNRVSATVRYDNLNGQGCMRLIEDEELDASGGNFCGGCGNLIPEGRTRCSAVECGGEELPT